MDVVILVQPTFFDRSGKQVLRLKIRSLERGRLFWRGLHLKEMSKKRRLLDGLNMFSCDERSPYSLFFR